MKKSKLFAMLIPIALLGSSLLSPLLTTNSSNTLTIPAAAFTPSSHTQYYENNGFGLIEIPTGADPEYIAPVYLPDDVIVKRVILFYKDKSHDLTMLQLYRTNLTSNGSQMMADVPVEGTNSGDISSEDSSIVFDQVDNANYGYYLWLYLYANDVYGVQIEYSHQVSLPVVFKQMLK